MAGLIIETGTPEILLARSSIIERQYPGQYPLSIAPTTKLDAWPLGFFCCVSELLIFALCSLTRLLCSLFHFLNITLNYPGFK